MDPTTLSKTMAHALRHAPGDYDLALDAAGWASLDGLLAGIAARTALRPTRADVEAVLALPGKRRYEVEGDWVRAFNGHSVETKIAQEVATPPDTLFHGTIDAVLDAVTAEGLKPMSRQYVHLSADAGTARVVAGRRRRQGAIVVLRVDAARAHADGVTFYRGVDGIWLADAVPARYLMKDS